MRAEFAPSSHFSPPQRAFSHRAIILFAALLEACHGRGKSVILSAVRTPIGRFQGGLAGFSAPELGGKLSLKPFGAPASTQKQIDEAILGNVCKPPRPESRAPGRA